MITFLVNLKCDHHLCERSTTAEAVLVGKCNGKGKIEVKAPEGWEVGKRVGGYGTRNPDEIECVCPEHREWFRGY